jgi:ABC-type xylose transport system permease subunit
MGWHTSDQQIIIGAVIVAAVFLDRVRQNRQSA